MFGLDARLSLAIFALITMIVGYLAYSRVQAVHKGALLRELKTFEEALQGYQADMGVFYPFSLAHSSVFSAFEPADPTHPNDLSALWDVAQVAPGFQRLWNGPYLTREQAALPNFGAVQLSYAPAQRSQTCTDALTCYVWLSIEAVPLSFWRVAEQQIDGTTLPATLDEASQSALETALNSGRVQGTLNETASQTRLFYRTTVLRKGAGNL